MRLDIVSFDLPKYRTKLFNYIEEEEDVNVTVHTFKNRNEDLEVGEIDKEFSVKEYESFRRYYKREGDYSIQLDMSFGMIKGILKSRADALLLPGYGSIILQILLLISVMHEKKTILWVRSFDNRARNNALLDMWKTILISMADTYIVPSERSKKYLKKYDCEENKIHIIGNPVDNSEYRSEEPLVITTPIDVVFVGRFNNRKGIDIFLKSFKHLDTSRIRYNTVGAGTYDSIVEDYSRKFKNFVHHGFVSPEKMSIKYNEFDLLVLPSRRDLWGLVINEAMNAGLPVVCSINCGAAKTLVKNKENGLILDSLSPENLADSIDFLASNKKLLEGMSRRSSEIILSWGFQRAGRGLVNALQGTE